jgi:hypothetical protein
MYFCESESAFMLVIGRKKGFSAQGEKESSTFRASLKMPAFVLKGAAPIRGVQTCFPLNSTASYFYFSPCMLGIQS